MSPRVDNLTFSKIIPQPCLSLVEVAVDGDIDLALHGILILVKLT